MSIIVLCSMFNDNTAAGGAAVNLIQYNILLYNVTFKNNRQSALRVSL